MATETKNEYYRMDVGTKRAVAFLFTASGTTGEIETGLSKVTFAHIQQASGATVSSNMRLNINSITSDDADGNDGWIRYGNGTTSQTYRIYAEGK